MKIKQLRQLKRLAEIPTHSPESLEELQELVRLATVEVISLSWISGGECVCENCEYWAICADLPIQTNACKRNRYNGFQLRMEDA